MRRFALILSLTLLPTACAGTQDRPVRPTADQAKRQSRLEEKRVDAQSGNSLFVYKFVASLVEAQGNEDVALMYGEVDWATLNREAEAMLDAMASSDDVEDQQQAAGLKAMLLIATGRADQALALYRDLHERAPSFETAMGLMILHAESGVPMADAADFCAANRGLAAGDNQTFEYMKACAQLNPSSDLATSLPWASEADLAFYTDAEAQLEAQRAARTDALRRADEERAASAGDSSDGSSGSSGAAAPNSVSITLRNTCPASVDVFFGDKPEFGSGVYSNLSPNTATQKSLRPGDMIWIVDDSQAGLSSITVSASTRTVEVTSSCTGLTSN